MALMEKVAFPQNDCQDFCDGVENIKFMRFQRQEAACHEGQNYRCV
jgi:hypothetical protein